MGQEAGGFVHDNVVLAFSDYFNVIARSERRSNLLVTMGLPRSLWSLAMTGDYTSGLNLAAGFFRQFSINQNLVVGNHFLYLGTADF